MMFDFIYQEICLGASPLGEAGPPLASRQLPHLAQPGGETPVLTEATGIRLLCSACTVHSTSGREGGEREERRRGGRRGRGGKRRGWEERKGKEGRGRGGKGRDEDVRMGEERTGKSRRMEGGRGNWKREKKKELARS